MNTGYVALTFDDGPHPHSTPALLAALAAERAPATFFLWGEHVKQHADQARALRAAGMGIGNHSYTHPHLTRLDREEVERELAETQKAIAAAVGRPPVFFRPPYGDTDERLRASAALHGLTEVLWTVDTCDWAGASTAQIVEAAAQVQPGGVILMHDGGYRNTIGAVPLILRMLAERGLRPGRIVRASEPAHAQAARTEHSSAESDRVEPGRAAPIRHEGGSAEPDRRPLPGLDIVGC